MLAVLAAFFCLLFFAAAKKSRCRPAQGQRVKHEGITRMPAQRPESKTRMPANEPESPAYGSRIDHFILRHPAHAKNLSNLIANSRPGIMPRIEINRRICPHWQHG